MSAVGIFVILAISIVITSQTQSQPTVQPEPPLQIVFPEDQTYVTQKTIKIIGVVSDGSIQQVGIRVVGGNPVDYGTVGVVQEAFEALIELQAGMNDISVFSPGRAEADAKITLFLRTGASTEKLPDGFKAYFLHPFTEHKTRCQDCHRVDATPANYQQMNILGTTCQTQVCHEDMGGQKYVHGPAAGGTCIACHNPHGSSNKYHVSRSGTAICLICHEDKVAELEQEHVHGVITMSGCTDCHDSHESPNKFQLQASTTRELCFTCHDDEKVKQKYVHGPVAAGDCNTCHNPHASPNKYQLVELGNDLCFLCHEIIQDETTRPNVHKPVKEACTNCHDPHASAHKKQLKKSKGALCFDCHQEIQDSVETVAVQHRPVAEKDCVKCHTPHGSDYKKLIRAPLKQLCFTCHKRKEALVLKSEYLHGPVQENDCTACHVPHGSANPKVLVKFFPAEFYTPYAPEKYALCFECHNKDIALDEFTTTLTDFRNGDRNLHYLHVHKDRKGRSCKACHAVHASNQPRHIRTEVPYGKMWSYPINYTKADHGGKCMVGCHKPKEYNRVQPVAYE